MSLRASFERDTRRAEKLASRLMGDRARAVDLLGIVDAVSDLGAAWVAHPAADDNTAWWSEKITDPCNHLPPEEFALYEVLEKYVRGKGDLVSCVVALATYLGADVDTSKVHEAPVKDEEPTDEADPVRSAIVAGARLVSTTVSGFVTRAVEGREAIVSSTFASRVDSVVASGRGLGQLRGG